MCIVPVCVWFISFLIFYHGYYNKVFEFMEASSNPTRLYIILLLLLLYLLYMCSAYYSRDTATAK